MKLLLTTLAIVIYLNVFAQNVIHLEMKSLKYKPIIEATINGAKAYFIVDTGSDISILDKSILKAFNVQEIRLSNQNKKAMGFNGAVVDIARVKNAQVNLGDCFVHNTFYTLNLKSLVDSIERKTDVNISGILGADLLIKYNCIIDYDQKKLTFSCNPPQYRFAASQ